MADKKEFDQIKYQNDYNKTKYDMLHVVSPKGTKEKVKAAAKAAGESMSEYINKAIEERMQRG